MKIRLLNDNPYGYRVDISTPEVAELYARFKKWKNIPSWCPLSDNERLEFESYILRQIEETEVK
jgi:hypothetical protein